MALDSPPWIIDGTTLDAEVIRRAVGSLLNPFGGVVSAGDLALAPTGTPSMNVQVGAGEIWIPGTSAPGQGLYYTRNDATVTLAIAAADPSNPRIDTVIVQIIDEEYAGTGHLAQLAVLTGTPTAGANLLNALGHASTPNTSLPLGYVQVDAGVTSIVSGKVDNFVSQITDAIKPKDISSADFGRAHYGGNTTGFMATPGTVPLDTRDDGTWNTSSGQYVVGSPGIYQVNASVTVDSVGSPPQGTLYLTRNGSAIRQMNMTPLTYAFPTSFGLSELVKCASGDTLGLQAAFANTSGGLIYGAAAGASTFMSTCRLA